MFSKNRSHIWRGIGMGAICLFVAVSGFFTAKFLLDNFNNAPVAPDSSETQVKEESGAGTETTQPADVTRPSGANLRAFYIPSAGLADTEALRAAVNGAVSAGFNAVLFDLKDENGALYYQSSVSGAAKAVSESAITTERLKQAFSELETAGLLPVVRIFAFKDRTAPYNVPGGKITLEGEPGFTWLDNSKEAGGKPWLNPYAQPAQDYILGVVSELSGLGAGAVLLDGVQFPENIYLADFGSSVVPWAEVLEQFIADAVAAAGGQCRIIHSVPGLAAFKEQTKPFGANPVTFGAPTVAPVILPNTLGKNLSSGEISVADPLSSPYEAVKLAATQIDQRVELIADNKPGIMPWIGGTSFAGAKEQIKALTETLGADAAYILYKSDGAYAFE